MQPRVEKSVRTGKSVSHTGKVSSIPIFHVIELFPALGCILTLWNKTIIELPLSPYLLELCISCRTDNHFLFFPQVRFWFRHITKNIGLGSVSPEIAVRVQFSVWHLDSLITMLLVFDMHKEKLCHGKRHVSCRLTRTPCCRRYDYKY